MRRVQAHMTVLPHVRRSWLLAGDEGLVRSSSIELVQVHNLVAVEGLLLSDDRIDFVPPEHLRENMGACAGRLPDEATRRRMEEVIDAL